MMMRKRTLLPFLAAALVASVAVAQDPPHPRGKSKEYRDVLAEIAKMAKAKPPSVASGTVSKGHLEHACELPTPGFGYKVADPKRKTHFGTDQMTFGIMELAALLQELHPGSPWMSIGDITGPNGGKLDPHINHQDGQDVDIAYFYKDAETGAPVDRGWMKCDDQGRVKGGKVVFDAERSFELLALWVDSPYFGGCEWILCFDPIKKILVEEGHTLARKDKKRAAAYESATAQLEKLLTQPKSSPHDDHFHVRIKRAPVAR
jgi:murein endopeptidase